MAYRCSPPLNHLLPSPQTCLKTTVTTQTPHSLGVSHTYQHPPLHLTSHPHNLHTPVSYHPMTKSHPHSFFSPPHKSLSCLNTSSLHIQRYNYSLMGTSNTAYVRTTFQAPSHSTFGQRMLTTTINSSTTTSIPSTSPTLSNFRY